MPDLFGTGQRGDVLLNMLNQLVANGYHKGIYLTSAALISAIPTGATGQFAHVTATNTLWIWNGSAWVDSTEGSLDTSFADTLWQVYKSTDSTAKFTLDLSGMSTATTRDVLPPVQDGELLVKEDVLDEDTMASDSAVYPPSQQSVKAFVEAGVQIGVSAYKTSDQAISLGVDTKILFQTESWDLGGDYASSTFTTPVAGRYRISGQLGFLVAADDDSLRVRVYVNSVEVYSAWARASGNSLQTVTFNFVDDIAASQTIEVWGENATSADTIPLGSNGTFMQVEYLGT